MIKNIEVSNIKDRKIKHEKIKVIAVDMDGTLLNNNHELDPKTYEVIRRAQGQGIEFIIVTGRDFPSAVVPLEKYDLALNYIVASGAEIRSSDSTILDSTHMKKYHLVDIYNKLSHIPVMIRFCSDGRDYFIGNREMMIKGILEEIKLFDMNESNESIMKSDLFKERVDRFCCIDSLDDLLDESIYVYKIYLSSDDVELIKKAEKLLRNMDDIAVASSFYNNLEITDINAQKGIVLKEYIEQLGYSMSEVMVIGDSMNDYSMISMDFGLTVAMENGVDKVKDVAKYITKSNEDCGVAYAIEKFCEF